MSTPIVTFSGAHPYRPQCVVTAARETFTEVFEENLHVAIPDLSVSVAERVTADIGKGLCPRCHDPLFPDPKPEGWRPAGSRATTCRCIPVCETCANWIEPIIGPNAVTAWPTDDDNGDEPTQKEIEAGFVEKFKASCTTAVLESTPDGLVVISDDGAAPIAARPHPGGWAEHGYDDTADERERQS